MRIIVGITGASGAIYGIRLLERLRRHPEAEVHLIVTRWGEHTLHAETGRTMDECKALAHRWHHVDDLASPLASGSCKTDGMVIAPCSIHTLSAIASGITGDLLTRAADVTLKEQRRLILMVRETPLHAGHLRNMAALAEMGAIIAPPLAAFYHRPQTILDLVDGNLDRILDLLGLSEPDAPRWEGTWDPGEGAERR